MQLDTCKIKYYTDWIVSKTVKLCMRVADNALRKEEKWVDGEREGEVERRRGGREG
jgi:hypothetical protein